MEYESDFLVIGSGVAGLLFALKVADHGTVTIITKRNIAESNTAYAQGGIASVFAETDSFEAHIKDTHTSGDGICNEKVVEMVVKNAPERIQELIDLGVKFNRNKNASARPADLHLDLCREGGHSHNRIVHADDLTGLAVEEALVDQVMKHKNITVFEDHIAIDLITRSTRLQRGMTVTTHEDYCYGAYVLDRNSSDIHTFCARTILLATGGAGKVYTYTSNPDIATGDGIAMAYRTGATVANLEFVQFHPTCLYHPDAKNFLISEAVRGDGGILINASGERFMENYSPLKELACRDVVARAIDAELKKRGDDSVFLDISHRDPDFIKTRFPNLYAKCLTFGIDMTKNPIPVVPAAHYMCGGVATDIYGRTNIQRLFAIGETACTGLHGANRLASNSLLEALVYAHNAADQAVEDSGNFAFESSPQLPPWDDLGAIDSDEVIMVTHSWNAVRRLMWNYVGIVRSDKRLERAKRRIDMIQDEINEYYWDFKITPDLIELRNIATVAELIIRCATHRKESRGLHYNIAYPEKNDDRWKRDTVLRRPFVS
ncbi:MAG: L-aspartate oxidase [Desulfobacteraceae bacterium]|nr:L-aspartate oxidase [Desulfobacteraceae bacterium]MBC2755331.1 L-aspartate oxidase [Desulfobacteraceae bacterium]